MALTTGNFLSDSGAPDPEVGVDGDHYRNTDNQDVYFKASSIWSLIGNLGSGADGVGSTILDDDGEPGGELGSDGFYYIDRITLNLWKKVSGIWDLIGGLVGAPTPGTLISRGTVVPDDGFGVDGYYYFRIDTGDLYHKEGGSWTLEGSWLATPTPASSIFLAGPGAPADILGENDNYYRDTDTQDIYQKQADSWVQIGNWLGGGGGSSGPFEVGTWDMTGAISPAVPGATVLSATVGGTAPAYTMTPDATLTGAGPVYWAAAESVSGLPVSGTDTLWADFTKPDYIGGDNLFMAGFAIVNESATIADVTAAFMEDPVTGVWGAFFFSSHSGPGADSIGTRILTNGVGGSTEMNPVSATDGSNIGGGIDFTTMTLVTQRDGGTVNVGGALDLTGMPLGETFKIIHLLAFVGSDTVSFADGSLTYTPSSEAFGRTGFGAPGSAIPPMGAQDGDVFKVTVAGSFGGSTTKVGDFAQLYDNESKIIVTRVDDVTAAEVAADLASAVGTLEGADTALDGRLDSVTSTLIDHGARIGDLEAAVTSLGTYGSLVVEAIDIPEGHTVTPYELGFEGSCGGYRELTIHEDGARIKLVDTVGITPVRTLVRFKASSSLGDEDRVVFDYSSEAGGGALIIPAKSFLKTVYEVIHDGLGGFKITAIPLEDHMHIRDLADGTWTDQANRDASTPHQVLDITGIGTGGAVGAAIPNPWQFQSGEVIVSLIGGGGDSITDLVLSNPVITGYLAAITLNATGPFVPGDSFSIKARRTMVGGFPKWVYSAQKLSSNA